MKEEEVKLEVVPSVNTKDIEIQLEQNKKIDEKEVESSLNYNNLTEEEKNAIDVFLGKVDVHNTAQVLQFGASAQNNISKFSDSVLKDVRTKSSGEVGDLLGDLVVEIKEFDSEIPTEKKNGIFGMFNSAKRQLKKIISKYDKIENNISKIENQLQEHKLQMMKDIAIFDTMYEKNLEYFKVLSLYIIAGERKLEELRNKVLPELQRKAEETGEQTDAQLVNDMIAVINRFEKRIYDLKTTRIISIQMAPQIRLIQNNDSELVEKIQSSIINTIPLWKNQVVIALGLTNAKNALGAQKQVTEATNEMLKKNSEILKQGTIEIAEESEKAIVNIETLQQTNKDIIDTLNAVLEIHANGKAKRAEAEQELQKIEDELKEKLVEVKL